MANRTKNILTITAAALMALFLPLIAQAQGNWDYRRDNNRYDNRALRDVSRRLDDRSRDFQRDMDRALDRSRLDGTRREDRINDIAREFHRAASDLRNSVGDGRNLSRSSDEARRVLAVGSRLNEFMDRQRLDNHLQSDWSQIRQDLRQIANIYGLSYNGAGNWGNNPWGRRYPN